MARSGTASLKPRLKTMERRAVWSLDLISALLHEMRQPLAVLSLETQLALLEPRTQQEYRATLEACSREVERLSSLVHRLGEMARARRSKNFNRGFSLLEAVRGAVETFHPVAEAKRVRIVLDAGSDAEIAVPGDELRQVVHYLLKLALERCPEASKLGLAIKVSPTDALLRVIDRGSALSAEQVRVFLDPLARDLTCGGAGFADGRLEWCLAKRRAEAWGGTFRVENGPEGCTVSLRLPRWTPAAFRASSSKV